MHLERVHVPEWVKLIYIWLVISKTSQSYIAWSKLSCIFDKFWQEFLQHTDKRMEEVKTTLKDKDQVTCSTK